MMVRYWTLSYEDLNRIRSRRGAENRLGFAVQLCLLRFPGVARERYPILECGGRSLRPNYLAGQRRHLVPSPVLRLYPFRS